jgi:hypothetical protein
MARLPGEEIYRARAGTALVQPQHDGAEQVRLIAAAPFRRRYPIIPEDREVVAVRASGRTIE